MESLNGLSIGKKWLEKCLKETVKNSELWIELDQMTNHHEVSWFWVKGHSNHRENDIADALAIKE